MSVLSVTTAFGQTQTVSGVVSDGATNEPITGASISVKGGVGAGVTDSDGKFSVNVPSSNSILVFTYLGYAPKEVPVAGQSKLNVLLFEDSQLLEEVVVVGYGTMRKKDLTGSIIQIRPDKLANENPKTIQDVLRGTSGISISYDPTAKGGGSIEIRGQRSVYTDGGHNGPLIVLDGMMFSGELSEINPDDIGQIDILKDASSAAIYGAQAANGVLIVTTKKGKAGKPVVNVTANVGSTMKSSYREMWSPDEYMRHRTDWYKRDTYGVNPTTGKYEAYQAGGVPTGYYENPDNLANWGVDLNTWRNNGSILPSAGESDRSLYARRVGLGGEGTTLLLQNYTDNKTYNWWDHTFRTGLNHDYNASVSGASDRINYYMSFGYQNNEGVIEGNFFNNIRSNVKVDGKVTDWLSIGANINFQNRSDGDLQPNLDINAYNANLNQLRNSPYSVYRNDDGSIAQFPSGLNARLTGTNFDFNRQYMELDRSYYVLNTIFNASVKLPFGITYSFNAAPRFQWFHDYYWESSENPAWTASPHGLVNRENSWKYEWALNNQIHWDKTFAQVHKVELTLVQEAERHQTWQDRIEARNFQPSDALGYHNTANSTKENSSYSTTDTQHSGNALLARLFYSYNDRYMLTTSIRRDGYSAFGTSNPYATFPSLALAWTFTNEDFFKWEPMDYGKLRVSFGENGNRALNDPYISLANLATGGTNRYGYVNSANTLANFQYLQISRMANPNLRWEKSTAWNYGIDFSFLKNRITGSLEYYDISTKDMIMNQTLAQFAGFSSMTTNLGEVSNKGIEFSITSTNIKNSTLEWSTTLNFSYNQNKIVHLYYEYEDVLDANGNVTGRKESDDINNNWFIGKPISAIWNYRVTGIWQTDEADEAAKYNQRPGDPKVKKNPDNPLQNGSNGYVNYNNDDKEFLGQTAPPVNWSLRNDFTLFENLSLSFNIYARMGHKSLSSEYLNDDNNSNILVQGANQFKKEYWTPENPSNKYARIQATGPTGATSVAQLFDRSFIRLENISIGYTLPKKWVSALQMEKCKVFGSVRNAALWQKEWPYGDPESYNTSNANSPYSGGLATRVFSIGLNATF
ncbi:SusC/RagA family TonB-linked outer membrane protein [Bacteroidia bacterium]|nr:SusC/RagA family TonB-linked outer membrane protein [Bacteroidia bacterium]